jgi:hypothetical protein
METLTKKQPPEKRFKPPMAEKSPLVRRSPLARNPQLRLAVSPVVIAHGQRNSPSPPPVAVERPPSTSALLYLDEETSLPGNCCLCPHFVSVIVYMLFRVLICLMRTNVSFTGSSSVQSKVRKLKSEIWMDMDPIYHGNKLIQARCKHWWKMHVPKYPILSRMARDVFAVTASTVASESAFSTSGRIVSDYRNRLSGNTIEALICFQNWLREAGNMLLLCCFFSLVHLFFI